MSQHHTGGSRWIVLSRLSNISVHAASGVTACACCHPGGDGGGGGGGGGEYEVEDASSVATATSAGWREGRTMSARRTSAWRSRGARSREEWYPASPACECIQ